MVTRLLRYSSWQKSKLETVLQVYCLLFIALGIVARVVAYLYNRSLFLDEALLASSVVQRDYAGLFQPLDYQQGAPIGFLLIVKTLVYLFGTSEYTLRLLPLLSGIGSIGFFYLILRDVFKDPRPYIGTAFYATVPFLIYFSIEFKPYMFDGFVTLLILYVFSGTMTGRFKPWVNILICALMVWFSFPAIFTVTACCIIWLIMAIREKQAKTIIISVITSLLIGASFLLLLLTYYHNISAVRGHTYWSLLYFPLIPEGKEDLELIYRMAKNYFSVFRTNGVFVLALSPVALGFLLASKEQRWFGLLFLLEVCLLLSASWLKRYAMIDRFLLFIIPLHALLIALFISELWSKRKMIALGMTILIVSLNFNSIKYLLPSHVYRKTMEINPILAKADVIRGDVALYLSCSAIPQYLYKTGYTKRQIIYPDNTTESNRVIFGNGYYKCNYKVPYSWDSDIDTATLMKEARSIVRHPKVYLLFVFCSDYNREALLNELAKSGTITGVMNVYETPLYCFSRTICNLVEKR